MAEFESDSDPTMGTVTADEFNVVAAEVATLRKRVEELEKVINPALEGLERAGWPCRLQELPDLYSKLAAEFLGMQARAEKAERLMSERDAILGWIDEALKTAHPDTDVSDFGRSFEIVRRVVDRCLEAQASDMRCVEAERERDELMENHQALGREYEAQGRVADKLQADLDAALGDKEVAERHYQTMLDRLRDENENLRVDRRRALALLEKRRENRG